MNKKLIVAILWGVNIALYIANIIITCIFGETLVSCIIGWLLASMLAGLIIFLEFRLIDKDDTIDTISKYMEVLQEFEEKYPYRYSEQYMIDNTKLQAENKELKEEIFKWQTQYASAYVNRQNALIAEKVELQQQLKELESTNKNSIKKN